MDYDKINEHLGEFGKYHQCVYFLVCLPAVIVAMNMLSYVFNSATPLHRCFVDGCDNKSTSFLEPWLSDTIPVDKKSDDFHLNQCLQFEVQNETALHCPLFINNSSQVSCTEWKYDKSTYGSTAVTTWNLVCDTSWLAPLSGSLWMVGVIIGAIVFGDLSDRFGRRVVLLYSIFITCITGFITPFSVNYEMFLIVRVIQAAATTGIYQTAYVLGLEVVGQSKRVFCGIGISIAFAIGEVLLGVMAQSIHDWRKLQLYIAMPTLLFLCYYWLLPESVRWLITHRRHDEAKGIIKKMAVFNKRSVPADLLEYDTNESEDYSQMSISDSSFMLSTSKKSSVLDLFRTRRLRWRTLNILLNWFMNTIGYYGISMNATNLQGDVYVDFILISLVEIPAYIFCLLVLDRFGRKKPLVSCMIIGGLSCISTVFVPSGREYKWVSIGLSLVGKFGCSAAFAIIYIFSVELFPTVLRNNGIGLSSFFAHIGGVMAPYIASLSVYGKAIPLLIFGSSSVLAGLTAIFLPETLNKKLPETVEDAENFTRNIKKSDRHSPDESEALIYDRDT